MGGYILCYLPICGPALFGRAFLSKRDIIRRFIGTGFLDTTRVAAGGTEIWKHIFTLNRDNILAALSHFGRNLASLETAIRNGDEAMIERILTLAKNNRDALGS